jgi:hypothetical protein
VRLTAARRLILRLLPPITRSFHNRLDLPPRRTRLLGKNPLKPLRRGLGRTLSARLCDVCLGRLTRGWRR